MGKVIILPETTKNPYELMGMMSGVAYGSDITDPEKNIRRGRNCVSSGHNRVLEYCQIYMSLEGYSARTIRQLYTHIGGMSTRVQRSTRYCNEENFAYYTPPSIKNNPEAKFFYDSCMENIQDTYKELLKLNIDIEDIANILPLGEKTVVSCRYNARTLSDMSRVRMCNRAYIEYRELMNDLVAALSAYSPQWAELCNELFKPKCEIFGYCNEEYSCGKYPRKELSN